MRRSRRGFRRAGAERVESRIIYGATKPPSRRLSGRESASASRRRTPMSGSSPRCRLASLGKLLRQQPSPRQTMRDGLRALEPIAQRGKIARTAAIEGQARQGAADVGRGLEARPDVLAQARPRPRKTRPHRGGPRSPWARLKGAASRSARRRLPGAVTVLSIAASKDPSRAPDKVRVSSRLARVAASMSIRASRESRPAG